MSPIAAFFAPYKLLLEIALIGSLAAGAVYGVHQFLEHERDIGRQEVRAEYATKLAEAKEAARKREAELTTQRDEAVSHANERDQTIRSLAASAGNASLGLRDTAKSISNSLSSLSSDAVREIARAYGDVFTECQTRRGSLAEEAERLNSEKRTLIEAWPKDAAPH